MKLQLMLILLISFSFQAIAEDVVAVIESPAPTEKSKSAPVQKELDVKETAKAQYNEAKKAARVERKASMVKFKDAIKAASALSPEEKTAAKEAARKERAEALLKFHAAMKDAREKLWAELGIGKEKAIAVGEPIKSELDKGKAHVQDKSEKALVADSQNSSNLEEPVVVEAQSKAPAEAPASASASDFSRKPSSAVRK